MMVWKNSRILLPAASVLIVIGLWYTFVTATGIPSWLVPAPGEVLSSGIEFRKAILEGAIISLFEAVVGFAAATIFALTLAILFVWIRTVRDAIFPLVVILQSMPMIAVAPIILVWLGPTAIEAKIIIVFLICFFPIMVNAVVGLESAEQELLDLMRTMGASRWDIFIKLRLPGAVPHIFSGLKVGVTLAMTGALVGELIGGNQGLGYLMNVAAGHIDTALMFAVLASLTILTLLLFYTVTLINRLMTRWQDRGVTVVNGK